MQVFTVSLNYILYGVSLFAAIMLFCSKRAWKEWFWLKVAIFGIGYVAVLVSLAVISVYTEAPGWLDYVNYSVAGYAIEVFMLFMFKERKTKLVYNVFAGSLVRFAAGKTIGAVFTFHPFPSDIGRFFITAAFVGVTYIPTYFFFARHIARNAEFRPSVREVVFIFILSMVLLPSAFLEPILFKESELAYVYLIAIEIVAGYGILGFQHMIHANAVNMMGVAREAEINRRRVEQYENFRGVIEVMNHKVHDLKHQIRHLAKEHEVSDEVLRGLEGVVTDYEAFVRTGNETLDTVLTEKKFYCISKKIDVKCMVDGPAFSFLSVEDMNALFGNLLDNAIEYLVTTEEENRRLHVSSSRSDFFLKLSVENYFSGELVLDDKGFPVTSKADKIMHGFGTKSIARIAEKYGGNVAFRVEDGLFKAQVIFPVNK
ncbi:MAG: GHKL domain-containing protein [Clostridiales bacterium]|nr:GHKL domain-containing protein [Clostridiales bacterium]